MGDSFKMDHDLKTNTWDTVPFDIYGFTVNAFVIEKATNKSLHVHTSTAGEGVSGFTISSVEQQIETTWTPELEIGRTTIGVQSSSITIIVERTRLVKAFTVCLLITNSALTICSAYVTLLVVTRRERMNDAVLFFPITVVLTVPAIRSLYPGSPPFGIYLGRSLAPRS